MTSKKLLITGGAGFIGSAVIRHIVNNTEHSVVNVDKLTYAGNLESLESIEDDARYTFEQVDICNAAEIKRVFNEHQPDIVMHLAAESHVDRSIDGPGEFIQTNIVGTYILLEEARDYWSGLDDDKKDSFKFHHVSTDEVYGDLEGKDLPIYGNGKQIRDWLYVDDHARALLHVALTGEISETYNIGGHNELQKFHPVSSLIHWLS